MWYGIAPPMKTMFNCIMQPTHKIEENIYQRLKNYPLRGAKPPLHYISEQLLDDTNENTSFVYIGF